MARTKNLHPYFCVYTRHERRCKTRVTVDGAYCERHERMTQAVAAAPNAAELAQLQADLEVLLKKVGATNQPRQDPREVLLDMVTRAHQMVAVLDQLVRDFTAEDLGTLGYENEADARFLFANGGGAPVFTVRAFRARHVKAVLELHGKWVSEAAKISKMTLSAGVEERLVRLAEQQSRLIADVLRGALEALPISAEVRQQALMEVAYRLRALEAPQLVVGPGAEES